MREMIKGIAFGVAAIALCAAIVVVLSLLADRYRRRRREKRFRELERQWKASWSKRVKGGE